MKGERGRKRGIKSVLMIRIVLLFLILLSTPLARFNQHACDDHRLSSPDPEVCGHDRLSELPHIGLCLTGHARTFETQAVRASLRWHVIEPLKDQGRASVDLVVFLKTSLDLDSRTNGAWWQDPIVQHSVSDSVAIGSKSPDLGRSSNSSSSSSSSGKSNIGNSVSGSSGAGGGARTRNGTTSMTAAELEQAVNFLGASTLVAFEAVDGRWCESVGPTSCPASPPKLFSQPLSGRRATRRRRRRLLQQQSTTSRGQQQQQRQQLKQEQLKQEQLKNQQQQLRGRRRLRSNRSPGCLAQMWAQYRCFETLRQHEEARRFRYSLVIRSRPDVLWPVPLPPLCSWPSKGVTLFSDWVAVYPRELSVALTYPWRAHQQHQQQFYPEPTGPAFSLDDANRTTMTMTMTAVERREGGGGGGGGADEEEGGEVLSATTMNSRRKSTDHRLRRSSASRTPLGELRYLCTGKGSARPEDVFFVTGLVDNRVPVAPCWPTPQLEAYHPTLYRSAVGADGAGASWQEEYEKLVAPPAANPLTLLQGGGGGSGEGGLLISPSDQAGNDLKHSNRAAAVGATTTATTTTTTTGTSTSSDSASDSGSSSGLSAAGATTTQNSADEKREETSAETPSLSSSFSSSSSLLPSALSLAAPQVLVALAADATPPPQGWAAYRKFGDRAEAMATPAQAAQEQKARKQALKARAAALARQAKFQQPR